MRLLTDFTIFDRRNGEHVTLADLVRLNGSGAQRNYEAIGEAAPVFEEEEAGQEDDYVDSSDPAEQNLQKLRTSAIIGHHLDYADPDACVHSCI